MHKVARLLVLLAWARAASAATIPAASCGSADVQRAIRAARTGDTIQIPAGSCTWTTGVSAGGRSVTIQGAGSASTVITLQGPGINARTAAVDLGTSTSRVTAIGFVFEDGSSDPDYAIFAQGPSGWRVDHCAFDNQTDRANRYAVFSRAGSTDTGTGGLVDHNTFRRARVVAHGTLQRVNQYALWHQPLRLGAAQGATSVVYVEDNTFTCDVDHDAVDAEYSGRYVARYNKLTNCVTEAHSIHNGTGAGRGPRAWEAYKNVYTCTASCAFGQFWRGGTGVAYDNTFIATGAGGFDMTIKLDNSRSWLHHTNDPPGDCDGSHPQDGNTPGENGWPCRDQIGRGADQTRYRGGGRWPAQESAPAYFWNNTLNGSPTGPTVGNCVSRIKPKGSCADIKDGRDYHSNTPHPTYTPLQYPHPLNTAAAAPPPVPPRASRLRLGADGWAR